MRALHGRLHGRLYVHIYLAFVGIIVLLTVVGTLLWRASSSDWGRVPPFLQAMAEELARQLPADRAGRDAMLAARGAEMRLRLTLWDAGGEVLAASGAPHRGVDLPRDEDEAWFRSEGRPGLVLHLSDGRWLAASSDSDHDGHPLRNLVILLLLAGVLALACHPLARRITRRLEALRAGVDNLGGGDLTARVPVHGHDEVAKLAESFNRAARQIEALVRQQKRVLASASHELRSPLTRLRMAVELLGDDMSPQDRETYRQEAEGDIQELDALIDDVLLVARLETPGRVRQVGAVPLLELVQKEAQRVGAAVAGEAVTVEGERPALARMLRNLLENAARHGGGAPISVTVEKRAGGVRVVVEDDGPGVAEGERERIFEPFYRPQGHAEGKDGGVGLGLALVRQVAQDHGGEVRYVARPRGSRFEVDLN